MKIVSIVGARPEFVQASRVSTAIKQEHEEVLIHTGQHYDAAMSGVFFSQLGLPEPDYNLGVGSGSHGAQTAEIMRRLEPILIDISPDWVIVRGDTNSTVAGALTAVKLSIPTAHIEAGLRSFNRQMAEETNRVVTDHIADLLLCPTDTAMSNLADEGLAGRSRFVGDVMFDSILHYREEALARPVMEELNVTRGEYVLATVHRAENTDDPERLQNIVDGLSSIESTVIFPAHPRTVKAMSHLGISVSGHVRIVEPLSYLDMLCMEDSASLIVTDSGGVQKEAFLLRTPCLSLRDETEWVETVEAGWNVLVRADVESITKAVTTFNPPDHQPAPYGDGEASHRIVKLLESGTGLD